MSANALKYAYTALTLKDAYSASREVVVCGHTDFGLSEYYKRNTREPAEYDWVLQQRPHIGARTCVRMR